MKKKRRYHLKKGVKDILLIIVLLITLISFILIICNKLEQDFRECDQALNQTCTFYDLQNYKRNK